MVIPGIVILPLLLTHVLSAPSGCIESCGSYVKQYQTQSSGSFQNQGATRLQGLDYSRPGTWSEHNDYDINNGHGKVHEEQGQVVDGSKTVRYYKKNYTSSYSTGYSNGEGLSEIENQNSNYGRGSHVPSTEDAFNSQRTYNQVGNSESIAQHKYNRIQNQQQTQSSIQRTNAQSERLEDFGEYSGNSQVVQGASDLNTQTSQEPHHANGQSGNWSKVDSYNTDGGRGRVFEEEGQYLSGPKKVRYYKRNYTSTYSSTGGIPIPEIDRTGVSDIHNKIENLHREVGKEFNQISTTGNVASTNLAQTNINRYGLASDNTHNINSNTYRSRVNHESSLSSSQHNEEQHFADTSTERLPYRNPFPNSYGTSNFRTYTRHEGRIINHQPTEQLINPSSGYTNVLNSGRSGYNSNMYNAGTLQEQSEHLDRLRSSLVQNQMSDDNLWRNRYNQNSAMHSNTPGRVAHYKEHWSSSQTKESSVPEYSRDISQHNEQSAQYNNEQYEHQHRSHQALQDQDRHMYQSRGDSFNSAHQTNLGKLMTGALNLGQGEDTVDCAHETTEHVHSRSQYQRKYKRSIKHAESSEMQHPTGIHDLPQQSHQPWMPDTDNQHSEDLTQQTGEFDDLTQQTSENLQFGQLSQHSNQPWKPGTGNQHTQDLTQQTSEFDDLTQQTSGKLEFGQDSQQPHQPWRHGTGNQQSEDLDQQTGEFDDLTQQTSGKLEFGQDSQQPHQPWRPHTGNQHSDDLTQQTGEFDDLSQQTAGKLEFGQFSQQDNKDLSMEPHGATMHLPKPAGKPKPRSRYSRIGSMNNLQTENQNMHNTISQQTLYPNSRDISVQDIHEIPPIIVPASDAENIRSQNIRGDQGAANPKDNSAPNNGNQPSESNGFNIVGGDGDQVNLLHKSNDATVGVQWHYTYHPSDERPFVQQPDQDDIEDMQQQSSHSNLSDFEQNLDQQETQDKYQQWNNQDTEASRLDQQSQKYGSEWESRQQTLGQPEDQQKAVRSSETKHKLEPRILEAYGGGPYDAHHDDDIYNGVTINPGATLPPVNSADAWDIREKPREITATDEVTPPPMPVEPLANDTDEVAPPLSFWSRIGSKITTTFDKAKEKAKHIFGKK